MRYLLLLILFSSSLLWGCNSNNKKTAITTAKPYADTTVTTPAKLKSDTVKQINDKHLKDKEEIQTLIRRMFIWAESKNSIKVLPVLVKDSICIGFDFGKLNENLEKMRKTDLFTNEFIDNYSKIIHTLDKKIKANKYEPWNTYELPTFNFANDVGPWCSCQDYFPWETVEVEIIKLDNDKGELNWNWGKFDANINSDWKKYAQPFSVVKVNNKWKIAYLRGFDYKEGTK